MSRVTTRCGGCEAVLPFQPPDGAHGIVANGEGGSAHSHGDVEHCDHCEHRRERPVDAGGLGSRGTCGVSLRNASASAGASTMPSGARLRWA